MKILTASNLSKTYRRNKVVHDVSITVKAGEIVGLLGPNGAGKTTSFHMIVGLIPSDTGKILINDEDVTYISMVKRARLGLGYLPQESSIFRKMSVEDNIIAILDTRQDLSRDEATKKLNTLLEEFHISHLRKSLGMSLSGGERRRVEIARALSAEPDFLLLDEPFAGIDPISIADIQRITMYLKEKGLGILISDHNVRETLSSCNRAYIVNEGHILAEGTPEQILSNEDVMEVYLGKNFSM
jgi:lipopolysaccharide export system ATP-binding protein